MNYEDLQGLTKTNPMPRHHQQNSQASSPGPHSPSRPSLQSILGQPRVTLTIYEQAAILTLNRDGEITEYAVNPADVSGALSQKLSIDTGFIPPDVVWIQRSANYRTIISYRPPQLTGIWLDGISYALHVPLPGLLMTHSTPGTFTRIFALASAPSPDTPLYRAPLPNIGGDGGAVCWGTVAVPEPPRDNPNDLGAIWTQLLGSPFVAHTVPEKSKRYPKDVRELLVSLHETNAAEYPLDDLVAAQYVRNTKLTRTAVLADLTGEHS